MKKLNFKPLLVFTFFTTVSIFGKFETGDLLELTGALNARSSMNFYSKTKNIISTLKKGTITKVEESIKLPSGNYGVRVTLFEPGKEADPKAKSFWVYFDNKKPSLKVVAKEKVSKFANPNKISQSIVEEKIDQEKKPELGDYALTMQDVKAITNMTPEEQAIIISTYTPEQLTRFMELKRIYCQVLLESNSLEIKENSSSESFTDLKTTIAKPETNENAPEQTKTELTPDEEKKLEQKTEEAVRLIQLNATIHNTEKDTSHGNEGIREIGSDRQQNSSEQKIELKNQDVYDRIHNQPTVAPKTYEINSEVTAPQREIYTTKLTSETCQSSSELKGVNSCYNNVSKEISSFRLENNNGDNLINKNRDDSNISRVFNFSFRDLAKSDLSLIIDDNASAGESQNNHIHMIFLPRKQLPSITQNSNDSTVTLPNGEKIIFDQKNNTIKSGVLKELPQERNEQLTKQNRFQYQGEGVVIKVEAINAWPTAPLEDKDGKKIPNTKNAIIAKKGFNTCKIPVHELWDYNEENSDSFLKKEFATDEALDKFLKDRCGFSMFD